MKYQVSISVTFDAEDDKEAKEYEAFVRSLSGMSFAHIEISPADEHCTTCGRPLESHDLTSCLGYTQLV